MLWILDRKTLLCSRLSFSLEMEEEKNEIGLTDFGLDQISYYLKKLYKY
jgi:hypothetical protein